MSEPVTAVRRTEPPWIPARWSGSPEHRGAESTETDAVLRVEGLSVVAGDPAVTLVSDVSFSVEPGQTVALVGESGCGKSMTALALLGPPAVRRPCRRRACRAGAAGPAAQAAPRRTAPSADPGSRYVAQDALGSLDPTHTVGSHLREVDPLPRATLAGADSCAGGRTAASRSTWPTPNACSPPTRTRSPAAWRSGSTSPSRSPAARAVLVADEPTTALDVTVQAEILALLRDLQESTGMAMLMITHDWGVVADIAHRAIVMYAGEVVEEAAVDNIFRAPRFPYTAALLAADPSTAAVGARLPTLAGRVPPPGSWPESCRFAGRCAHVTRGVHGGAPPADPARCRPGDPLHPCRRARRRRSPAPMNATRCPCARRPQRPGRDSGAAAGVPASGRSTTSASPSLRGAPWAWSASPAPASRRWPRPSSVSCRSTPEPSACGATTSPASARPSVAGSAVRCRRCSRTRADLLNPSYSIAQSLAEPMRAQGIRSRQQIRSRIEQILVDVGMDPSRLGETSARLLRRAAAADLHRPRPHDRARAW